MLRTGYGDYTIFLVKKWFLLKAKRYLRRLRLFR